MSLKTNTVSSGYSTGVINSNFKMIEEYVNDNLLNRDGVTPGEPNQMEVDLDMNSQDILNVGRLNANRINLGGTPVKQLLDNTVREATQEANRAGQEADRAKREADRAEIAIGATAAQIKQLYESNPDTNAFTDDDVVTLAGIQPQIDGINLLIGDVASALDAINGEVV